MDDKLLSHYQDFIHKFCHSRSLSKSSLHAFRYIIPFAQKSGLLVPEMESYRMTTKIVSFAGIDLQETTCSSVLVDLVGRKLFSSYTELHGPLEEKIEFAIAHTLSEYKKEGYVPLACGVSINQNISKEFSRKYENSRPSHRFPHKGPSLVFLSDIESFLWAETTCNERPPLVALCRKGEPLQLFVAQWVDGNPHSTQLSLSQITSFLQSIPVSTPVHTLNIVQVSSHPPHYHPAETLAMGAAHMVEQQVRRSCTFTLRNPVFDTIISDLFIRLFPQ